VAPIISEIERPVIQPADEHRRGRGIGNCWMRPNNDSAFTSEGTVWMRPVVGCASIISPSPPSRLAAHHTVGVAADKIAVALAPGVQEVANVAGFWRSSLKETAAVVNFPERIEVADELAPTGFLLRPSGRDRRVAQDEKVKPVNVAGCVQAIRKSRADLQPRMESSLDREDDRGADTVNGLLLERFQRGDTAARAKKCG